VREYRLTAVCSNLYIDPENSNHKDAFSQCAKKSANEFMKGLEPVPDLRFTDVFKLVLLQHESEIEMVGTIDIPVSQSSKQIIASVGSQDSGLYFTSNHYNDEPIPDSFRRRQRRNIRRRRLQSKSEIDNKEGFKQEFRTMFRDELIDCLKQEGFLFDRHDAPPSSSSDEEEEDSSIGGIECSGTSKITDGS